MRTIRFWLSFLLFMAISLAAQNQPSTAPRKSPGPPTVTGSAAVSTIEKHLEAYLRKLYAWGPSFRVKIGPLSNAPVPGFYQVPVEVTMGGQSDSALVYVSKDGRYLLRGDMQDMSTDPLAAVRAQIHLADNPSRGPANTPVTLVEYSDFQCPSCRRLHEVLREITPNYPQIRIVYKDYPLVQVHPWAMTAAIAGRCAYQQSPAAFWILHDSIFDNQDAITPENVWQKLVDFALQAGLEPSAFRNCMASQQAAQAVQQNIKEGQALKVANTPTVFVNGRRLIGGDRGLLEQYIQYELASQTPQTTNSKQ